MIEIERRFLCRVADEGVLRRARRASLIRQGYLTGGEPAVRIRERDGRHTLTVKAGRGRVRREVELPVEPEAGAELLAMAGERRLEKTRYELDRWEVDVFQGKLRGLVLAEIELEREDERLPEPPEGVVLLREVTEEGRFTNQNLAMLGAGEAARLVRKAYGG